MSKALTVRRTNAITIPTLKEIAAQFKLAITGTKLVLLSRVWNNPRARVAARNRIVSQHGVSKRMAKKMAARGISVKEARARMPA